MGNVAPKTVFYSDFDFTFAAHPQTGRLMLKKNTDAISQAIKLLILTNRFERPFRPKLAGDITKQLFNNYGPFVATEIKEAIAAAVQSYEPRAIVLDVKVVPTPDQHSLDVTLQYRPVQSTSPVTVVFSLERLR